MSLANHIRALVSDQRKRLVHRVLAHRVRARHPTLVCCPTAIWDYGFDDLDAIDIGKSVTVNAFARIVVHKHSPRSAIEGRLILRDQAIVGANANLMAAGGLLRIGVRSAITQNCVAVCANHLLDVEGTHLYGGWDEERTGVELDDNVWVGAGSVLLPGTRIGRGSVVAAGSVVRGEIPAGELWGGSPAKRIRSL